MRSCVICLGYFGDEAERCPTDGAPTWPVERFSPAFGRRFGADHVVLDEIARGGMSVVYRAVQASIQREEAVKVLPSHPGDDGREVRRFLMSAALARRLADPRSVRVFAHGQEDDGTCWLAMELLRGRTLQQALADGEAPMKPRRACDIAIQVLQALQEAHGLDLIHRDVKPDNVFLVGGGHGDDPVKLLDFGLVRTFAARDGPRLTLTGTAMGTPSYMSPEQGHGRTLDVRSDLYAVGVLLFEMLSGRVPHDDLSGLRILLKKVAGPAPRVKDMAPEVAVPDALEDLVADLLEVDPGRRPASAAEVIARLEAACPRDAGDAEVAKAAGRRVSAFRKTTRSLRAMGVPPGASLETPEVLPPATVAVQAAARAAVPPSSEPMRLARPPSSGRRASLRIIRFPATLQTGITRLDDQHRDLFDLADAALGGPGPGTTPVAVLKALEMLVDYADKHFQEEEESMAQEGFGGLTDHRKEHQRFAESLGRLGEEARRQGSVDAIRAELRRQMSLLVRHVRNADGAYAAFLRERGVTEA